MIGLKLGDEEHMSFLRDLLICSAVAAAAVCSAQPTDVITAHGREFSHNGKAFRFVGVNMRGLVHYGLSMPLPYTQKSDIDYNLDGVAGFGGKVIRVFAASKFNSNQTNIDNLRTLLDKMEARGMKALICMTDAYDTGYCPQGDAGYYQPNGFGYNMLTDQWFTTGYKTNYLPWVQACVGQLKNHNAVFAWEIGNELTCPVPADIIPFVNDVAHQMKVADPWHMVCTGFISVDHTQIGEAAGKTLYENPDIDIISVHSYNGDDPAANWATHARVEKPLIVGEYGWESSAGPRVTNTQAQVDKWFDVRQAQGFLQWGYQYNTYDIGDGDSRFGMDRNFFASEYNAYASIYSTRATAFATNPPDVARIGMPTGMDVALSATSWSADSSYNASCLPQLAGDGIVSQNSKWTSNGNAGPHWIACDLGSQLPLNGFVVHSAGDAGEYVSFGFKNFEVQTGTSLSGPWTTVATVSNPNQIASYKVFLGTPVSARYVRLYITNTGIDNYARLPEFEIYSGTSSVSGWEMYD